jgi:hypothetical protein
MKCDFNSIVDNEEPESVRGDSSDFEICWQGRDQNQDNVQGDAKQ